MMIAVWFVLAIYGFRAERLHRKPFLLMLAGAIVGTAIYDQSHVRGAAALGQDESWRWHPAVFAGDVALTTALWAAVYCIAYAVGRRRRTKALRGNAEPSDLAP